MAGATMIIANRNASRITFTASSNSYFGLAQKARLLFDAFALRQMH